MKIMFICTANTCRSVIASEMFKDMLKKENKDNIEVYSCGIYAENGDISPQNAIETMEEYGIDLSNHRAINIKDFKIEKMDIILCATLSHKIMVLQLYPNLREKIFTVKEYAGLVKRGKNYDILDPWGYDLDTYKKCAIEIKECLEEIIQKI